MGESEQDSYYGMQGVLRRRNLNWSKLCFSTLDVLLDYTNALGRADDDTAEAGRLVPPEEGFLSFHGRNRWSLHAFSLEPVDRYRWCMNLVALEWLYLGHMSFRWVFGERACIGIAVRCVAGLVSSVFSVGPELHFAHAPAARVL